MSEIDCLRSVRVELDRTVGLLDFLRGKCLEVRITPNRVLLLDALPGGKVFGAGKELLDAIQDAINRYDAEEGRFHPLATRHQKLPEVPA